MNVCYCHVTYAFQSESTLYSRLNSKVLLARNRRDIWNLSDSNGVRTRNHLACKRTLNLLAKLANLFFLMIELRCECLSVRCIWLYILSCLPCHVRVSEWIYTLWLPECQGTPWYKLVMRASHKTVNYQRQTESKSILIGLLFDFVMIIQKHEEMNYRELWWWIIKKLWYCTRAWVILLIGFN